MRIYFIFVMCCICCNSLLFDEEMMSAPSTYSVRKPWNSPSVQLLRGSEFDHWI